MSSLHLLFKVHVSKDELLFLCDVWNICFTLRKLFLTLIQLWLIAAEFRPSYHHHHHHQQRLLLMLLLACGWRKYMYAINQEKLNTFPQDGDSHKTSTEVWFVTVGSNWRHTTDGFPRLLFYCGLCGCSKGSLHVSAQKVSCKPKIVTFNTISPGWQFAEHARGIFTDFCQKPSTCFPDSKSLKLHTQLSTETARELNRNTHYC